MEVAIAHAGVSARNALGILKKKDRSTPCKVGTILRRSECSSCQIALTLEIPRAWLWGPGFGGVERPMHMLA